MPIVVRAVPEQEFNAWLAEAKTKFSDATPPAAPSRADRDGRGSALTRAVGA